MARRRSLDQAAAVLVASQRTARDLGVAADRLVYLHGADMVHVDIYSCFASAVEVACRKLGLSDRRGLMVTGGCRISAGRLRGATGTYVLIATNGSYLTKHAAGIYFDRAAGRAVAARGPRYIAARSRRAAAGPVDRNARGGRHRRKHDAAGARACGYDDLVAPVWRSGPPLFVEAGALAGNRDFIGLSGRLRRLSGFRVRSFNRLLLSAGRPWCDQKAVHGIVRNGEPGTGAQPRPPGMAAAIRCLEAAVVSELLAPQAGACGNAGVRQTQARRGCPIRK